MPKQHPPDNSSLATQPLFDSRSLETGTLLADRFRVVKPLGSGAQASVYQVFDTLLDSDVALKILSTTVDDGTSLGQLRNEVNVARKLQHPNVVPVYDVYRDDQIAFFTMALVEGVPLHERLLEPVSGEEYERWARQLLEAASICQQLDILHGDIKPDNLLVDHAGNLQLIDFGIGKNSLQGAQYSGHEKYSAPEVMQAGITSAQSETFSIGRVLEEMLTNIDHAKTDKTWRDKHWQFTALLTNKLASQRPTPSGALLKFIAKNSAQTNRSGQLRRRWLAVAVAVVCTIVGVLKYTTPATAPVTERTVQVGFAFPLEKPILKTIQNVSSLALRTYAAISLSEQTSINRMIRNLQLDPVNDVNARTEIAGTFALDVLILLDSATLAESGKYQIDARALLMPDNTLLGSQTFTTSAEDLSTAIEALNATLTANILNHHGALGTTSSTDWTKLGPQLQMLAAIETREQARQAQQSTPDAALAWLKGAELAFADGDLLAARDQLQTLFALPSGDEYWQLQGQLLQAEIDDNLSLAQRASGRLFELYPDHLETLITGAEIALWAQQPERAVELYEKALERAPYDPQLWFQLARQRIIAGDVQTAITKHLTQALLAARRQGDRDAEGLVLNAFGVAYLRLANYDTALSYFNDALRLRDAQTAPIDRANTLANLANVATRTGDYTSAESALKEASILLRSAGDVSDRVHILDTLGVLYEEQSQYQSALGAYSEALELVNDINMPDLKAQSMSNVAYMHFLLGDFPLAEIYWQQAKAYWDKNNDQFALIHSHQNLASLYLARGEFSKTSKELVAADSLITSKNAQEQMISHYIYSQLHFLTGKLTAAQEQLAAGLSLAESTQDSRSKLALLLWQGEICLRIADFDCVQKALAETQPLADQISKEHKTVMSWLEISAGLATGIFSPEQATDFVQQLPTLALPLAVQMKIKVELAERLDLEIDNVIGGDALDTRFFAPYVDALYRRVVRGDVAGKAKLDRIIQQTPEFWRNHIYLKQFDDERRQALQTQLERAWLEQMTPTQQAHYREYELGL